MRIFIIVFFSLIFSNCTINHDSQNLTENLIKDKNYQKNLIKILKKKDDITLMTFEEYENYVDDFTKKSNYPDLSK